MLPAFAIIMLDLHVHSFQYTFNTTHVT